jgi:hypothetical protein
MSELQNIDRYLGVIYNDTSRGREFSTAVSIKQVSTLIARLALLGCAVDKGRSGDFLVSTRGITHYCQDFESLKAFAQKVGVIS